jgi:hypothetical protein
MNKGTSRKDQAIIDMSTSVRLKTGSVLKSNGYDTVPKIIRNVINPLIKLLKDANAEHDKTAGAAYAKGLYLMDEAFIPEYAGFTETVIESQVDSSIIRIYSRGEFLVFRNTAETTEKGKDKWIIKNTKTQSVGVYQLDNMLEAAVVLISKGVDVTMLDIVGCKFVV